jgi:hypothetical protein
MTLPTLGGNDPARDRGTCQPAWGRRAQRFPFTTFLYASFGIPGGSRPVDLTQ